MAEPTAPAAAAPAVAAKPAAAAPVAAATPAPTAAPAKPATAPTASVVAATPGAAAAKNTDAKPVTTAPAPTPAAAKPADTANDDVAKALANWAGAWSRKDMRAYLGAYASDFNTPKGVSRKEWEAEREQRIAGKGGKISVSYDAPAITVDGDRAVVKFRQHYSAPGLSTSTTKTLVFVRSGGKWLIKEENSR